MAEFLNSREQFLEAVAKETAKMSYPGRMGGVVKAGTKKAVETYFVETFPLSDVWEDARRVARNFDRWHEKRVRELVHRITRKHFIKKRSDRGEAFAAKFLNTYMHQLMKYEPCRPLWNHLHLPLDKRILEALWKLHRRMGSRALGRVNQIIRKPPYSIEYADYIDVQRALSDFIKELNARPRAEIKLRSRIELNLLWAG